MALNKQIVPVNLNGIDTKTDPKQVVAGKLLTLQNGIFKTAKEIRKRNGFNNIPNAIQGAGTLSTGVNVGFFQNELTILDGSNFYSYSAGTSNIFNKGALPTTQISTQSVIKNEFQQITPDSAFNGSFQVTAWQDSSNSGNIRYSVIDTTTGQSIVNNQQVTTNASQVKVMALGTKVLIFYNDSGGVNTNLYYKYLDISTPTVLSAQQTLATDSFATYFDCVLSNGQLYITYVGTGNKISIYYLTSALVKSAQYNQTIASSAAVTALNIFTDASFNIWVAYGISSGAINVFVVNNALTASVLASTTLATVATNPLNITGIVTGTTATIYYDFGPLNNQTTFPSSFTNQISYNTITIAGSIGTPTLFCKGLALASKVFIYNGVYYVLTVFPTNEQATYFVLNQSGLTVAKILPGIAGGVSPNYLPEVNSLGNGNFQFTTLTKDLLVAYNSALVQSATFQNNQYTNLGVESCTLTFTLQARPKVFMGNNLHYGGGLLWMYDGNAPVEHGYNIYPEGLGFVSSILIAGAVGVGTSTSTINQMQYSAIYEWTDNEGQLHRSAASVPITVNLPNTAGFNFTGNTTLNSNVVTNLNTSTLVIGQIISNTNFPSGTYIVSLNVGASTMTLSTIATATAATSSFTTKDIGSCAVTIPTLRLTAKKNVTIILYRTTNNGTIFYRLNNPQTPLFNDPTVDSVTFTDTIADSVLITNEQLYTTGGEVDNIAAPAVSALTSYRNRAIYLTPENPYSWGYSKQVIPGSPVEFNSELFTQAVDPKGGYLTAVAEMDDKLILFKNSYIFYVTGEGPSPSGLNSDYQDPQVISTDTGCNNQNSIVLTPIGLMFQSPKGIYLLNRSLGVSYIGAEVEAFNSQTVTSAILVTSLNQVRFTLNSGVCLVYDYYFQQWSVFTNINAADSTQFQNVHTYISPAGIIWQENLSVYTDNGAFIPLYMQTSWFSFAGLQGFERFYKMLLLGDYKSPHNLNITVAFDFDSTSTAIDPIPVLSNPGVYQYRIFMPKQKCEAFQLTIGDSQTAPFGEGFSLSGITLEVGMKQGLFKMPAASSYG